MTVSPLSHENGQLPTCTRQTLPLAMTDSLFSLTTVTQNKKVNDLFSQIVTDAYDLEAQNDMLVLAKHGAHTFASRAEAFAHFFFQDRMKLIKPFIYVERLLLGSIALSQQHIGATAPIMSKKTDEVNKLTKELNLLIENTKLDPQVIEFEQEKIQFAIRKINKVLSPLLESVVGSNQRITESKIFISQLNAILADFLADKVSIISSKEVRRSGDKAQFIEKLKGEFATHLDSNIVPYLFISFKQQSPEKLSTIAIDPSNCLLYDSRYGCLKYNHKDDIFTYLVLYCEERDFESVTLEKVQKRPPHIPELTLLF